MNRAEFCALEAGLTGKEAIATAKRWKKLWDEYPEVMVNKGFDVDDATVMNDASRLQYVEDKMGAAEYAQLVKQINEQARREVRINNLRDVGKKARENNNPAMYWDYAMSLVGYRSGLSANKGEMSAEGYKEALLADMEFSMQKTFNFLFDRIAGTTMIKRKVENEKLFLEEIMKDGDFSNTEAGQAAKGYYQTQDTLFNAEEKIYGKQPDDVLPSQSKKLPVIINPELMIKAGRDEWVATVMRAVPDGLTADDVGTLWDEATAAAMGKEGFMITGNTRMRFRDVDGYLDFIKMNEVPNLATALNTSNVARANDLGVKKTIGNPKQFVKDVKQTALDMELDDNFELLTFRNNSAHLESMVDYVTGDLEKSVGRLPMIQDQDIDIQNGIIIYRGVIKDKTIQLTEEDIAELKAADEGAMRVVASKIASREMIVDRTTPTKVLPVARSLVNVGRLGQAVFGFLGEANIASMQASLISDSKALSTLFTTWQRTFNVNRNDLQDFAMRLGGMSADMRGLFQQMARGASESEGMLNSQTVHNISNFVLEGSGFKPLVSNSTAWRADLYSRVLTKNLEEYGVWDNIPAHYREYLSSMQIDRETWNELHRLWNEGGDIRHINSYDGQRREQLNLRGIENDELRMRLMASMIQFQKVGGGEKIADTAAGIARGYIGGKAAPRGSSSREIAESIFTFMNWPVVVFTHILRPYYKMSWNNNKRIQQFALVSSMIAAGYVVFQAKNILRTGEIEETNPQNAQKHLLIALSYSGVAGLWSGILADPYEQDKAGPSAIAQAPIFEAIGQTKNILFELVDHAISSLDPDYEKTFTEAVAPAIHTAATKTIVPNIWWSQGITKNYGYEYFRQLHEIKAVNNVE